VLHPLKKQQPAGGRHREPAAPAPAAASVPDTAPAPQTPTVADATGAR
jgi:hypothetical protein